MNMFKKIKTLFCREKKPIEETKNPMTTNETQSNFVENPVIQTVSPFGTIINSVPETASATSEELTNEIVEVLKTVFDPEIPVNIYDLGLIYDIAIPSPGEVSVKMTLTSPACPVAGTLPPEVETKIKTVPGVTKCVVDLVWDPPWDRERMSEAAKLQLNMF